MPPNIFAELNVTFETAGTITLTETEFGPPSAAHAHILTSTDDRLLGGTGDIFRRSNHTGTTEPQFNLSHTCFVPAQVTTTTTTTTAPAPTTTTAASTTTTDPDAVLATGTGQLPRTGGGPTVRVEAAGILAVVGGFLLLRVAAHVRRGVRIE